MELQGDLPLTFFTRLPPPLARYRRIEKVLSPSPSLSFNISFVEKNRKND
jgi:hypothetical protein